MLPIYISKRKYLFINFQRIHTETHTYTAWDRETRKKFADNNIISSKLLQRQSIIYDGKCDDWQEMTTIKVVKHKKTLLIEKLYQKMNEYRIEEREEENDDESEEKKKHKQKWKRKERKVNKKIHNKRMKNSQNASNSGVHTHTSFFGICWWCCVWKTDKNWFPNGVKNSYLQFPELHCYNTKIFVYTLMKCSTISLITNKTNTLAVILKDYCTVSAAFNNEESYWLVCAIVCPLCIYNKCDAVILGEKIGKTAAWRCIVHIQKLNERSLILITTKSSCSSSSNKSSEEAFNIMLRVETVYNTHTNHHNMRF